MKSLRRAKKLILTSLTNMLIELTAFVKKPIKYGWVIIIVFLLICN